jgi:ribonuclease P protein component
LPRLDTLKRRPDFLAANAGARASRPGFVLLGLERDKATSAPDTARFGLTVTKRIGNAVKRNRARRRLRALARLVLAAYGRAGWDYVLIARQEALTRDFRVLAAELESALEMIHKARRPPERPKRLRRGFDGT